MSCLLDVLPLDVWALVPSYCYWKEWNHFLHAIQQPLTSTRSSISEFALALKKRTIILKLNKLYSLHFYTDPTFRNHVCENVVASPIKQISLIYEFNSSIGDVSILQGVHNIKFAFCKRVNHVSTLTSLQHLSLYGACPIEDLSPLIHLESLDITSNDQLVEVPELFGHIPTLRLSHCNSLTAITHLGKGNISLDLSKSLLINQVNHLANVKILNLSGCSQVTDVSMLGNVTRLDLSYCHRLTDVSALGRVHHLNLKSCPLIQDISGLGQGNYYVNLSYCKAVTDITSLATVHTVILINCTSITHVNCLRNAYEVDLTGCEQVSDVSELGYVHTLSLSKCHKITDLSGLGKANYYLDLRQCHGIDEISSLSNVHELNLSYSTLIEDEDFQRGRLTNVVKLNISGNNYIQDLSKLENVEVLDISFCRNIQSVSCLPKLKTLIMYGCKNVRDLEELPKEVVIRTGAGNGGRL